ncbi:MAG TPA: metalloregulator ArsR/SmtB family transcription factor [Actinomycetota bacterium]|nr:metalloregulator ArsR/SmtB family transcription factor [Actinomycetota bacterium]
MAHRAAKEALFDEFARVAKALSSGRRAEIVDVLANGERSVESLAQELDLTVANVSQHLQVLRRAGLVKGRRDGTFIYYGLAAPEVVTFWRSLQDIAGNRVSEVERLARAYLGDHDGLEAITKDELKKRLRNKDVFVLDVRPPEEFEAGHIPGALSIPAGELKRRLRELPKNKEIVAYCRGQYCSFAPEAVRYLASKGYDAKLLREGLPDWALAGLPVEHG